MVHGRNRGVVEAMDRFLRSIKLEPLYFDDARKLTGKATPFTLDVVKKGLAVTQATVVLMTMEDVGCLREQFRGKTEPTYETELTPKPRQNVIFEAGMAMALRPKLTVLVEVGQHHHTISDLAGLHIIRMDNTEKQRRLLVDSLENAGCRVDRSGSEWKSKEEGGDFEGPIDVDDFVFELGKLLSSELQRLGKEHGSPENLSRDRIVETAVAALDKECRNVGLLLLGTENERVVYGPGREYYHVQGILHTQDGKDFDFLVRVDKALRTATVATIVKK
jgi:hypothetical protein